jgi:YVTN family beta-propeller protein
MHDSQTRLGRRALPAAAVLALLVATVDISTVASATASNAWRATIGSSGANGTATIQAYTSGTGSIALKLAKFKAAVSLPVALSKGTCSSVGTMLIRFSTIRTTSTGAAARTSSLTASQVTLVKKATAGTGRIAIRVGSATTGGVKCGAFTVLPVPAYVAATIPVGNDPMVQVNAGGIFVLSWEDGTVSRIDPGTNSVRTTHLTIVGNEGPDSIAYGEGALWVTMYNPDNMVAESVERLDALTGNVLGRIQAGSGCDVATSPGAVWTANERTRTIDRIDPATNQVVATVPVAGDVCGTAFAFGSVWVWATDATISRIDPATNQVVAIIPVALADVGLVYALGSVWAMDQNGNALRVDPATNQVAATIPTVRHPDAVSPDAMTSGAGSVWVADPGTSGQPDGALSRIDPTTNRVTRTIPVGINPAAIAFGGGYVWVTLQGEPIVVQVDAATNAVRSRINVGGIPSGIAASDRAVWVTVPATNGDATTPPAPDVLVRINF